MEDITRELEALLDGGELSTDETDLIERCLDIGYEALPERDRGRVRQLINRRTAATVPGSALARYRLRRAAAAGRAPPTPTPQRPKRGRR